MRVIRLLHHRPRSCISDLTHAAYAVYHLRRSVLKPSSISGDTYMYNHVQQSRFILASAGLPNTY